MKTIVFIRHGKSSWDYQVPDKDRPLKERGIHDANLVSAELKIRNLKLDFAFSSPANRALHTAMIVLRNLNYDLDNFKVCNDLYDFSGESTLSFLKGVADELNTIIIFGHNYAFTSLVNTLGDTYIENVPTSGLVEIQFNVNQWSRIEKGATVKTIFPKELR